MVSRRANRAMALEGWHLCAPAVIAMTRTRPRCAHVSRTGWHTWCGGWRRPGGSDCTHAVPGCVGCGVARAATPHNMLLADNRVGPLVRRALPAMRKARLLERTGVCCSRAPTTHTHGRLCRRGRAPGFTSTSSCVGALSIQRCARGVAPARAHVAAARAGGAAPLGLSCPCHDGAGALDPTGCCRTSNRAADRCACATSAHTIPAQVCAR